MPNGTWKTNRVGLLSAWSACCLSPRRRGWFHEDFSTIALERIKMALLEYLVLFFLFNLPVYYCHRWCY